MIAQGRLDARGSFDVEVEPGVYTISISGVDHANAWRTVFVADDLEVSGTLGTYARPELGASIGVVLQFVDADGNAGPAQRAEAVRVDADRYRVALGEIPAGAVELRHQIVIGGGRTTNASGARKHIYDGGGDFWSVVPVPGDGGLVLDLRQLPPPSKAARIELRGEDEVAGTARQRLVTWLRERDDITRQMARRDGKLLVDTTSTAAAMDALRSRALRETSETTDPRLGRVLHALYAMSFATWLSAEQAHDELRWFIGEVGVDEPLLGLGLGLDALFFRGLQQADPELDAAARRWLERCAREHSEPGVAVVALELLLFEAANRGDEVGMDELYSLALAPRFEGAYGRDRLVRAFDPHRVLRRGNVLPELGFAALGEPARRITKQERNGELYLVEFWATWCGPCVAEMPKLHDAYAAINRARRGPGKGIAALRKLRVVDARAVEFVFVSFDQDERDIAAFRAAHWSMPWTHAFVGQSDDAAVMERFGIWGVPTAILVDEHGKIIEYGAALRGDRLRVTLERVIAERSGAR